MHVDQLGRHADHVQRFVLVDLARTVLVASVLAPGGVGVVVVRMAVMRAHAASPPLASLRNHAPAERATARARSKRTVSTRSPPRPAPATRTVPPSDVPRGTVTSTP